MAKKQCQFNNLVLSGGAFKACAFIGCLKVIEEKSMRGTIKNVIASSAGTLIGIMFCAGLNTTEMRALMSKSMHRYLASEFDVDDIFDIFDNMGIDDGRIFTDMVTEFLLERFQVPDLTFLEFTKKTGMNFVVTGSNVSLAKPEYFSVDTTPTMSVVQAIRISISLPFIMKPVIYKDMLYVDASLFNNFPVDYFNVQQPFQDSLALLLSCPFKPPDTNKLNLLSFTRTLFDAMFERINKKDPQCNIEKNNLVVYMTFPDDNYGFDMDTMKLTMNDAILDEYIEIGYAKMDTLV